MSQSQEIRAAFAGVQALRDGCHMNAPLHAALQHIKTLQARRFAATYADRLHPPDARQGQAYADATRFFLTELYSPGDYTERDAQFARMAGAMDRLLPERTVAVMTTLARLHLLTETLDLAMAQAWVRLGPPLGEGATPAEDAPRYVAAWAEVGQPEQRQSQLDTVLSVGRELARLTRMPGLRTLMRVMRPAARAAGLGALQHFLETGFDTFGAMNHTPSGVAGFLDGIKQREQALLDLMHQGTPVARETFWRTQLGLVRTA